jgi:ribokinase
MKKILVIGSSNTDMIIKVKQFPAPGETVLGGKFLMAAGGKGANQAVAAARAGGEVNFIACLGNDAFAKQALLNYVEDKINIDNIIIDKKNPSGVALILVSAEGENSIAVASGANAELTSELIQQKHNVIKNADILLLQLETPLETVIKAAEIAHAEGVTVILNPAPVQSLPKNLWSNIDFLTPNTAEAEQLSGIKITDLESAKKTAHVILDLGVRHVIITLGDQGALLADRSQQILIPSFIVNTVDTTAAGDTFNGALAVALSDNMPLIDAVKFANAAAALSVTKNGAQPSIPRREEILQFLQSEKRNEVA